MRTLLLAAALAAAVLPAPRAGAASPVPAGGAAATTAPVDTAFQEALLLEEGRRDLPAALRAYEAVVAQVDAQRALAATAVFRLGEVHRKLGRTNDAVAQYRRLLRDFPAEETLARLSRENLAALGAPVAERGGTAPLAEGVRGAPPRDPPPAASPPPGTILTEEIARLEAQLAMFRDQPLDDPATLIALQQAFPDAQLARLEETILEARREVSVIDSQTNRDHPTLTGKLRQLKELEEMLLARTRAVFQAQRLRLNALKAALPGQVTFFGEVNGTLEVPAGATLSLADAILRLPPGKYADLRRVRVLRPAAAGGSNTVLKVNLEAYLRENDRAQDVALQPGDRVEVPQQGFGGGTPDAMSAGVSSTGPDKATAPAALAAQVNDFRRRSPLEQGALAEFLAAFPDAELERLGKQLRDAQGRLNALGSRSDDNASDHDSAQSAVSSAQAALRSRWQAVLDAQALRAEAAGGDVSALEAAEIARLTKLLDQSPDLLNATAGDPPQTPLQRAAAAGQLAVVRFLLARGADVNARGGFSPALHSAARAGHRAVVEALLEAKADPNAPGANQATPLQFAAGQGFTAVVETLLARGADPNLADAKGTTPLIAAARFPATVEILLSRGADPNLADASGTTPVIAAARFPAALEILLNRGAVVTPARQGGYTALHEAVSGGNVANVERLLRAGAEVNARTARHDGAGPGTPLTFALGRSQVSRPLVETLIRAGAVVDEPPGDQNPLTLALGKRDPALLGLVLTAKPTNGFAAGLLDDLLGRAVLAGSADAVAPLLLAGASPETTMRNNPFFQTESTVLMLAASRADAAVMAALLQAKPDVNRAGTDGWTALHFAASTGATNVIRLLLDAGADPNRLNQQSQAPLNLVLANLREQQGASPGFGLRAIGAAGGPGTATEAADWRAAMVLLRAAGAREDLPRRQWILLRRGQHEEWFFRRAGDDPPPRVADILQETYGMTRQGRTQQAQFSWPDFTVLRVHRLANDGPAESELPVVADWPARTDCDWNLPLAWGDALEIPEADHPQDQAWPGLGEGEAAALNRCTARTVTLTVKDQPADLTLLPATVRARSPGRSGGGPAGAVPGSCRLGDVLQSSRLLRASSDLARVQVTRATGQTWTLDVQNDPRAQQFWLLDGDRILVPEVRP